MKAPVIPTDAAFRQLENDRPALLLMNDNNKRSLVSIVWLSEAEANDCEYSLWESAKKLLGKHASHGVTSVHFQYCHQELNWIVRPEDECAEDSQGF